MMETGDGVSEPPREKIGEPTYRASGNKLHCQGGIGDHYSL